ncbi:E3 ubiquitin-protein ligase rnf8-B [Amphibalanus amphitrite]|uniref:E3 ubiquitin-protein ligase rnf8-B n=1 Tax=Amphibalanus amphitrite TaxID=1232801 RepID=A0A6A4VJE2_AMPAM|nr:E3 ubiquitin-protein ligase rnf8-B [Amphibalanus amphitrite]
MTLENLGFKGKDDLDLVLTSMQRKMRGVRINLCYTYNANECASSGCRRLHLCYPYVLGRCTEDECELSHSVTDGEHNLKVLREADMANEPASLVVQTLAEVLTEWPLRLTICRDFWRNPGGCEGRCRRLHACPSYIKGNCWYGERCYKRHNLCDPHNQRTLAFFGCTEAEALAQFAARNMAAAEYAGGGNTAEAEHCGELAAAADTRVRKEQSDGLSDEQKLIEYLQQFRRRKVQREQERQKRRERLQHIERQIERKEEGDTDPGHHTSARSLTQEPRTCKEKLKLQVKQLLEEQEQHVRDLARFKKLFSTQLEYMKCAVCKGVFKRPVTLSCSHTFCEVCVESRRRQSEACPLCFQPVYATTRCSVIDKILVSLADIPL